ATERVRVLTRDLQRERAERQRLQGNLLVAEKAASGTAGEGIRDTVSALEGVWLELGVGETDQQDLMARVAAAMSREAHEQLEKAREDRISLGIRISVLWADLRELWALLGTDKGEQDKAAGLSEEPLIAQAGGLTDMVLEASIEVTARAKRRAELRDTASSLLT
ncbi:unnamed protein product, partial [Discosporangium mesarthrocarpum]